MTRTAAAALLATLAGRAVAADEVAVPLRIELRHVRDALVEQVFTEPGPSAAVWRDGTGCGWLDLRDPLVDVADGRLRVEARGEAQIGTPLGGGRCLPVLRWKGFVEAFEEPGVDAGGRALAFRVVDSNLYDDKRSKGLATGRLWDLVKEHVHPRLETLRIDLGRPFEELREWLPEVLPGSGERIDALLASMALRDPRVEKDAVVAMLVFRVDPVPPPAAPEPEPPVTEEELRRWDAFLTFVTKAVARTAGGTTRQAVMDVLLDGRHELLEALATDASPGTTPDPVPGLFLRTWERLASLVRTRATELPADAALRFTTFVAAGDALAALVRLGPAIGVDLSADGLRRLARMIDPSTAGDPLDYEDDVDPELRALFGLRAPPPPPEVPPEVDLDVLSWLVPPAAAAVDPALQRRLNTWIPTASDLDAYLRAVRDLLIALREERLAAASLEQQYHRLYRDLVLATAWQESCWRQFIRRGGRLVTLRSPVGSVGIMQVNERVWRGVYDRKGLLGDMAYNARAGAEILLHYLRDYAIAKGEHRLPGGLANLARATYAIYNGGPRHLSRYRVRSTRRSLKAIDDGFWEKLVAVQQGRELEVARCWGL